jgi:transcriptional regulator with XRE-family HTH domain
MLSTSPKLLPEERLKQLRESRSLTVRDVAKLSQGAFTASQVSNLETGVSTWPKARIETLQGLARAYEMTVTDLIAYVENRPIPDHTDIADLYKPIATYSLTTSKDFRGEVEKVEDELALVPDIHHSYEMYRVYSPGETQPRMRLLARKYSQQLKVNHVIICDTPDWGVTVSRIAAIKDNLYSLECTISERSQIVKDKQVKVLGLVTARTEILLAE